MRTMLRTAAACAAATLLLAACGDEPPRPQRMQTVKLLPDTPPPPPPRPEEKRPEPKREDKPVPQQPKPEAQPEAQALRSDEAAGEGPGSGLVAGTVTQDYTDQKIGGRDAASAPAAVGVGRLAATAYASAATRALNDFLARERQLQQQDWRVPVHLWLQADGRVQRAELAGSTGDREVDEALRAALARFPGTGAPLPERMPQPVRLQVSNRMIG